MKNEKTEPRKKLEVMVVDDDEDVLGNYSDWLGMLGYNAICHDDSYHAIRDLAIRSCKDEAFPDIYLCDVLDRKHDYRIAYFRERAGWGMKEEPKPIWLSITLNLHNYLRSQGITPEFFLSCSAHFSDEDRTICSMLNIPLIKKWNW